MSRKRCSWSGPRPCFKVPRAPLLGTLEGLAREGRVVLPELPDGRAVYKRPAWLAETGVAQSLGRLVTAAGSHPPLHLEDLIARVQQQRGLVLAPEQARGGGRGPQGQGAGYYRRPRHRQDHHCQLHPGPLPGPGGPGPAHGPHRPGRQAPERNHRHGRHHHPPGPGIFPPDRRLPPRSGGAFEGGSGGGG